MPDPITAYPISIAYIEVTPTDQICSLSPSLVKLDLMEKSSQGLQILWDEISPNSLGQTRLSGFISDSSDSECNTVTLLPYLPCSTAMIRCRVWAAAVFNEKFSAECLQSENSFQKRTLCSVEEGTFVRVMASTHALNSFYSLQENVANSYYQRADQILACHDKSTVNDLTLRLRLQLQKKHLIFTTHDAKDRYHAFKRRSSSRRTLSRHLQSIKGDKFISHDERIEEKIVGSKISTCNEIPIEGGLCIFDDVPGSGKTTLAAAVASKKLNCEAIHVIKAGELLARFGIRADTALVSILHQILLAAAFRGQKVCIILDGLQTFVPGPHSQENSTGPILNAIAAYISNFSQNLRASSFIPVPNSILHNLGARRGFWTTVQLCLVGIMTCPPGILGKDGFSRTSASRAMYILGGRFALPPLSAKQRYDAFLEVLKVYGIVLENEALEQLPAMTASTHQLRAPAFARIVDTLRACMGTKSKASEFDLREAFATIVGQSSLNSLKYTGRLFEEVGGNAKAKLALEDALALDDNMRLKLSRFKLSLPTGVLLYGPPGCGKTILARATSQSMRHADGMTGESFFALKASEVVLGTVGSSEKAVAKTFEAARINSPSVVFIDEFEALFTERGRNTSGGLSSVLLQCLDDITEWRATDSIACVGLSEMSESQTHEKSEIGRVIVLAATNMPWMIDKAFMRPGRFDRIVYVGLPTYEERSSIFEVHLRRMKLNLGEESLESLCAKLAYRCEGFSGADISGLCRAAAIRCLNDDRKKVTVEDFLTAKDIDFPNPTSNPSLVMRLKTWKP